MPGLRSQYHFRRTRTGIDAWDVARLIEASRELPVRRIAPSTIAELNENHWYFHDESVPTPLSIVEHVRLINACDVTHPIILDAGGRVMDGMHRLCRAILDGLATVPAVQFEHDPEPDFVDCNPDELPYGD